MRKILPIIFLLTVGMCFANMASPLREGTLTGSAFSSLDIDILKENINLIVNEDFQTGKFFIDYHIRSDSDGIQIPLLFIAKDYKSDFKVWVDGRETKLLDIPSDYTSWTKPLSDNIDKFSDSFNKSDNERGSETVTIYWNKSSGIVYDLNDLKYFETDLSKGEHLIRVEYTADAWVDRSGWVKEYSFRYSLSPAKNWRSFTNLEISINSSLVNSQVTSSLGDPAIGKISSIAEWNFSKLPADFFTVNYTPKIKGYAKSLIDIGPENLTLIFGILVTFILIFFIYNFRKRNPSKKISWIVITGSIFIPFLIILFYMFSFDIIDNAIGPESGNYHGYTFLAFFFYPLAVPIYSLMMWLIDKKFKALNNQIT